MRRFRIYAWNEFGEGGIVAPTKGDEFMKLEAIKEMFGGKQAGGCGIGIERKRNEA